MALSTYVIRAGDLRRRVSVQRRDVGQDDLGQPIETWATLFKAWADISPLSGKELMAAGAIQSAVTHEITMRYRPELADPKTVAQYRVLYGTRVFNIHASLNQDERNRAVILQAEEGLSNG